MQPRTNNPAAIIRGAGFAVPSRREQRETFDRSRCVAAMSVVWLTLALDTPTASSFAALDTATSSIPIDPVTTLEMHTTDTCVRAENQ